MHDTDSTINREFISRSGERLDLNLVVISSSRLLLEPISLDFTQVIFQEFNERVTHYMFPAPPKHISETQSFILEAIEKRRRGHDLVMTILKRDRRDFLGCCGFHGANDPKQPEFGVWLRESAHGSGYGREAIKALYDWAERTLVVKHYIYPVDRSNIPSRKVAEALGGVVVEEKLVNTLRGTVLDEVIYRIPTVGRA